MFENGYYPTGTQYLPQAPWNIKELPKKDLDVAVSQSLSKNITINTNLYYPEFDDSGECNVDGEETNWGEVYEENHYTPLELIQMFKKHLQEELFRFGNTIDRYKYQHIIEECDNWIVDDYEVVEN